MKLINVDCQTTYQNIIKNVNDIFRIADILRMKIYLDTVNYRNKIDCLKLAIRQHLIFVLGLRYIVFEPITDFFGRFFYQLFRKYARTIDFAKYVFGGSQDISWINFTFSVFIRR